MLVTKVFEVDLWHRLHGGALDEKGTAYMVNYEVILMHKELGNSVFGAAVVDVQQFCLPHCNTKNTILTKCICLLYLNFSKS